MRIYIAGGAGMLGKDVYERLSQEHDVLVTDIRGSADDLRYRNHIWWQYADVCDYHQQHYILSEFHPHVVMNLAAETDLEYCEGHGTIALSTNAGGSAVLAALAQKFEAKYVYISTAGIFDGYKDSYSELDPPNPLSIYGKGKYYGELIAQAVPGSLIVRPGWMMGGGPLRDKKFINKVYKQLVAGAIEINAVADKAGTPTYTNDLAKQIEMLLTANRKGLFNTTCLGATNRYQVAKEFIRLMGLEDRVKVNLVGSEFFKATYTAQRPASEVLNTRKLEDSGLCVMRNWEECLAEYVKEFQA